MDGVYRLPSTFDEEAAEALAGAMRAGGIAEIDGGGVAVPSWKGVRALARAAADAAEAGAPVTIAALSPSLRHAVATFGLCEALAPFERGWRKR